MKTKILLILTFAVAVLANKQRLFENSPSQIVKGLFNKFIKQHNKVYSAEEHVERFLIFTENLIKNASHLLLEENPKFSPFFDLTTAEFKKFYLSYKRPETKHYGVHVSSFDAPAPLSFDWRLKGAVTPVKNQGQCGSCWAFSAIGNIEGQYAINENKSLQFSEQQLVDCDTKSEGCGGGFMANAFEYLIGAGGVMSEDDYAYKAEDRQCKFDKTKVKAKLKGFNQIAKDELQMKQALFENGPLSVAVNATRFHFYTVGILDLTEAACDQSYEALNHGVVIVGYGTENGKDFWIIKNSWGPSFGENGYVRLSRNKNTCGISNDVSTAVLANN